MSEIIRQGLPLHLIDKPWVGKILVCRCCSCEFKLTIEDKSTEREDKNQGRNWTVFTCPHCHRDVPLTSVPAIKKVQMGSNYGE